MKAISSKKSLNTVKTEDILNLINGVNEASVKAKESEKQNEPLTIPENVYWDEE